jgi:hypothetical protein
MLWFGKIPPADLAFVCCIEGNAIAPQALMLCESIRRFGGAYARSQIVAVNARPHLAISAQTERRLAELGVEYVSEPLNVTGSPYLTINRIVAGSWAESQLTRKYVVLLDSDMLFVRAPSFARADAGVRPVDVKGSTSTGPGDPLDAYWASICRIAGLSVDALPYRRATVDGARIRASYNGGFCIVRRSLGILRETHRVFEESRLQDLRPLRGIGASVYASTGLVGAESSEWWGSSQAALSAAIHARARDVRLYDERYNVPVHLLVDGSPEEVRWPSDDLILVHYHWLCEPARRTELRRRLGVLGVDADVLRWLCETELLAA